MVDRALDDLDLAALDILIIENVGNLVCPTHWALGEHLRLCLVGAAEGHDKPIKYPPMFAGSDVIVLTKTDLIEAVGFDRTIFYDAVRALNPRAPIFELSSRTGEGFGPWTNWLAERLGALRAGAKPLTAPNPALGRGLWPFGSCPPNRRHVKGQPHVPPADRQSRGPDG